MIFEEVGLDRPRIRVENNHERLAGLLKRISASVNRKSAPLLSGSAPLTDDDCRINVNAYRQDDSDDEWEDDQRIVSSRRQANGLRITDSVRAFYKDRYGLSDDGAIQEQFRKEQQKKHGFLVEMAVTAALHKFLKEDLIITRTAEYDDLQNGVDNIILDQKTGQVICAFDEVEDEAGGQRISHKLERMKSRIERGGSRVKYGFRMKEEDGKKQLFRSRLANIPLFYLGLSRQELGALLDGIDYEGDRDASPAEKKAFEKFIQSIEEQVGIFLKLKLDERLKKNLEGILPVLERMRNSA